MEATLSSFKTIAIAKSEDTTVKQTSGKKKNQSTKATWSYFKKPLNELLDIFSQYYNISIEYDKDEMKKLYFTGDLLQDDSMRKNISIICIASGLEYDLNEEVLIIRKREE